MNTPIINPDRWVTDPNSSIKISDIVDRSIISERLSITKQAIGNWAIQRERTGFPKPIFGTDGIRGRVSGNAPCLYYWPDIISWYEQWDKLRPVGGRPMKPKG